MLIQLWSVLRAPQGNFATNFSSITWFASLPAGPIHRNPLLTEELKLSWPTEDIYLRLASGFLKCALGIFLSQHLQNIDDLIARGSFPTVFALAVESLLLFYCQLSGVTDLAVAVSKVFGVRLPENFDEPLKAQDLSDFWRRWHISLNQWFFHEVYLPLALFFQSRFPKLGNIMVFGLMVFTTVLIGLWHGFHSVLVFWGLLNGMLLVIFTWVKGLMARVLSWAGVLVLFLVMRLESRASLRTLFEKTLQFRLEDLTRSLPTLLMVLVGTMIVGFLSLESEWKRKYWAAVVFISIVLGLLLGHADGHVLYPGY
jgi:D-alanyl-lipoteichoic acid acyltransferase DltB (MBOAT superfamily)